jgi:hypothetical protein
MVEFHVGNDPRYWRDRAEKVRHAAESMTDPVLKKMTIDIAAGYERLAKRAAERRQSFPGLPTRKPADL